MHPPDQVLVLKPSSLGDIVHTLPAVSRLKASWPATEITWLVNPEWAPLLRGNPDVARILEFPRRQFGRPAGWAWLRREILGRRPALALDFQGLLRSALLGWLSGARRLHGLADAREGSRWFYQRIVPLPAGKGARPPHAVERYLALVDDLTGPPPAASDLRYPLPPGEPWEGGELSRGYILLHPFSRGAGKSLNAVQVRQFCEALDPHPVVVVGKTSDPTAGGLEVWPGNVCDLSGKTSLWQLIWLLRRAAFTISVDSGPMHLAAALSARLVGLHAWSDPRQVGPYNPGAHVWKSGRLWQVKELGDAPDELMKRGGNLESDLNAQHIQEICAFSLNRAGA